MGKPLQVATNVLGLCFLGVSSVVVCWPIVSFLGNLQSGNMLIFTNNL